jgi:hypothetical protein
MLKLNASFSKKVPVPGQDYSSKGYSAEISVELPDNLNQQQLQERIHNTFALVEASVEAELQNGGAVPVVQTPAPVQMKQASQAGARPRQINGAISAKQLKYVNDLIHNYKFDPTQFLQQVGLNSVYELSKAQSSQLIDLIKSSSKAA